MYMYLLEEPRGAFHDHLLHMNILMQWAMGYASMVHGGDMLSFRVGSTTFVTIRKWRHVYCQCIISGLCSQVLVIIIQTDT